MLQDNLEELLKGLRDQRDWVTEANDLSELMCKLEGVGKVATVRELARLTNKSKSWVGVSLIIAKGLKLYPEIEKFKTRNEAYVFLLKKNKFRRFLES